MTRSIPARLARSARAPRRIIRRPAVVGPLIVFPVARAMLFDDALGAFVDRPFQIIAIRRCAVLADRSIHFCGSGHSDARVADFVLQQVREIARPLFLHFRQDIGWRRPARHGRHDGRRRAEAGAGTTVWSRSELETPLHAPLGVSVEPIFERTRVRNGLPNLAEARACDGIEIGRPMNRLRASTGGKRDEDSRERTWPQQTSIHGESLDRKFWCA